MSSAARLLLVTLLLTPASLAAQFSTEVAHVRDGVRWLVQPSAVLSTSPEGVVRIELTGISARTDRGHGILVDGQRYDHSSFNGEIAADIDALQVGSLSVGFTFDGVQGCAGRLGLAVWKEGEAMTLSCNRGSVARFTGYTVNGLTTSGVLDLQRKIRQLRNAQTRAAQAAQQQPQSRPATGTTTGTTAATGTTAGVATRATVGTGGAASGATSGGSSRGASTNPQAAQQAEAERRAEEARVAERQRVAAEAERAATIDQMAGQVSTIVTGIAGSMAEDRRRTEAYRQRQEAQRQAYRQRVAENFRRMPEQPLCRSTRGPAVTIEQSYAGRLTGTECRVSGGASAVQYTLELRERSKVAVALRSNFLPQVMLYDLTTNAAVSQAAPWVDTWLNPGSYNIVVHSELAGETGDYTVSVQKGRRSWAGGWQMGFGMDVASSSTDSYSGNIGGPGVAFRLGTPIRQGPAVEERATFTVDMSMSEAVTTVDAGLRVYVLGKKTPLRPYMQASYGFVSLCSQDCIDSDISGSDYYYSAGTAMTLAAGLQWHFQPQYAIDLGYFSTRGTLDEGPMTLNRFRIGMALHASKPLPPR